MPTVSTTGARPARWRSSHGSGSRSGYTSPADQPQGHAVRLGKPCFASDTEHRPRRVAGRRSMAGAAAPRLGGCGQGAPAPAGSPTPSEPETGGHTGLGPVTLHCENTPGATRPPTGPFSATSDRGPLLLTRVARRPVITISKNVAGVLPVPRPAGTQL